MSTRIAFRARYGPYLTDGPPVDHVDAVHQVETATVVGTITPGTAQVETATIVGTIGVAGAGFAKITVTAAGMANSPKDISVAVANNDTAAQVAGKVRSALGADVDVIARFAVSGATDKVILTALTPAANDGTLNIASDNDTCSGLTTEPTSADTTPGVAPGTGDAIVTVTAAGITGSPKDVAVAVVAGDDDEAVAGKIAETLAADVDVAAFFTVETEGPAVALVAKVAADNDATMNVAIDNDTCTGLTGSPTSEDTAAGVLGVVGTGEGKIEKGGELIDTETGTHYLNVGARLEPAYRGSGAGTRLIGPFTLAVADVIAAWDTDHADVGVGFTPDAGDFIVDVLLIVTTAFDDNASIDSANPGLNVGADSLNRSSLSLSVASTGTNVINDFDGLNQGISLAHLDLQQSAAPGLPALVGAPVELTAHVVTDDGNPPALGSADLYFLVTTPVAP